MILRDWPMNRAHLSRSLCRRCCPNLVEQSGPEECGGGGLELHSSSALPDHWILWSHDCLHDLFLSCHFRIHQPVNCVH